MTEHDELMAELGAALDVEPSPAFAAGVRARIDQRRQRAWWMWGGVAAACATVAAVIAMQPASVPSPAPVTIATASVEAPGAERPTALTAPTVERSVPAAVPNVVEPHHARASTAPGAALVARVESAEPKLEVITNQPALLRELWQGRVLGTVEPVATLESPGAVPVEVQSVEVEPIAVPKIVVDEFVIRRVSAVKEQR